MGRVWLLNHNRTQGGILISPPIQHPGTSPAGPNTGATATEVLLALRGETSLDHTCTQHPTYQNKLGGGPQLGALA